MANDEHTNEPWLTDPLYGGMSPKAAKNSYEAAQSRRAEAPTKNGNDTAPVTRFSPVLLDDIAVEDDPVDLVEGLLPMGPAFGLCFGAPKSLKSFFVKFIALHITAGLPFHGRRIQAGAVVYVTSEGVRGVKRRLIAMRRALGIEGTRAPFFLIKVMPNLGAGADDRKELEATIKAKLASLGVPLRMIVIDTVRRATPGKSENKPEDGGAFLQNCDALATAFECLVLGVHHAPRADDGRPAGWNGFDAAADVGLAFLREKGTKRATCEVAWNKDGDEGDVWSFKLMPADVAVDREGKMITSCYVEITGEPERKTASTPDKVTLSPAQRVVYDILLEATTEAGERVPDDPNVPPSVKAISREALKAYCKKRGFWNDDDDKKSNNRLSSRLTDLQGKHVIGRTATHFWLAGRPT